MSIGFPGRNESMGASASAGANGRMASAGDSGEIGPILALFPGPVRLRGSRLKSFVLLAGSLAFVALAIWVMRGRPFSSVGTLEVWLGLIFFGLCALVAASQLLPGAVGLTLDAEGFERVTMYAKRRASWRQVGNFMVGEYPRRRGRSARFVGYDDARLPANNMSRMIGCNAVLPDSYGFSHGQLMSLMNQWRARALAQPR